jgi:hypothetical protein
MRYRLPPLALLSALALTSLIAAPRLAVAGGPPSSVEPLTPVAAPTEATVWYGYQNLAVDAGAFTTIIAGVQSGSSGFALLSLGIYTVGSPIVHMVHDNGGRAAGSLALRLGLPVLGGMIGVGAADCSDSGGECWDEVGGLVLGGLAGITAAVVIDDFVLAREVRPAPRSWSPTVAPTPGGGMSLGVAGTF